MSKKHFRKYYNTNYIKTAFKGDLKRINRLRVLFAEIPSKKRILSVGCGPGVDIKFLLEANEVHGIDISSKAVEIAKSLGVKSIRYDAEDGLMYPSQFFDVVICVDLLEHLYSPKFVLTEIHRVLKNDGYAIVSVPNHFIWYMRARILLGKGIIFPYHKSNPWDYFHIRFLTLQSFLKLLYISGFEVVKTYYYAFFMSGFLLRWIKSTLARKVPSLFAPHFAFKVRKRQIEQL